MKYLLALLLMTATLFATEITIPLTDQGAGVYAITIADQGGGVWGVQYSLLPAAIQLMDFTTEFVGGGIVLDNSGNGYNGTNGAGAAAATWVDVTSNQYASFDGGDYIEAHSVVPAISSDIQGYVSAWCYIDIDTAGNERPWVFSNGTGAFKTGMVMDYDGNAGADRLRFWMYVDEIFQWDLQTANNFTDALVTNWAHIVVNQNGTAPQLWVNAQLTSVTTNVSSTLDAWMYNMIDNATTAADSFTIGASKFNSAYSTQFNGDIDKTRIGSTALTGAQVTNLFNESAALFGKAQL